MMISRQRVHSNKLICVVEAEIEARTDFPSTTPIWRFETPVFSSHQKSR
jgi:hypothetical protein